MSKRGLIGAWCPSLGATGFRLLDRSGRNNHATLINTASTDWITSGGKGAIAFNGTSSYGNVVLPFTLDLATNSVTVSFWNRNTTGTTGVYASLASSTNGTPFLIFQASGTAITLTHRNNAGGDAAAVGGTWQSANWRLLTGISTPTSLTLLVNGVQVATTSRTAAATSLNQVTFSALNRAGSLSNYASSQIDDLRVFARAVSLPEIRQMYIAGRGFGLLPERARRRAGAAMATTNRRRRLICGSVC